MHSKSPLTRGTVAAVVFLAAVLAFLPCLWNEFLHWDDIPYLVVNERYRGFSADHLRFMFTDTVVGGGPYQPLGWLSFAVDHALWGMDDLDNAARGFHLTNVLLHALAAAILASCVMRLLPMTAAAFRERANLALGCGVVTALLWAIHPLRVESVAWAWERREPLSAVLLFLSLRAWLSYVDPTAKSRPWSRCYWIALVLFTLSLLAKATPVGWPLVLLAFDLWPLRRKLGPAVLEKLPFLAAAGVISWVSVQAQSDIASLKGLADVSIVERIVLAGYSAAFYVEKTLVPVGLRAYYLRTVEDVGLTTPLWIGFGAAVVLTGLIVARFRTAPAAVVAWAGYLVLLAPFSGLIVVSHTLVCDRFSYLPMVPLLILLVGWAGARLPAIVWRQALGAGLAVCIVLGASTAWLCTTWRDTETLFGRVVAFEPDNWFAHGLLGEYHRRHRELDRAVTHFERVLEIRDDRLEARVSLAVVYANLGRHADASHQINVAVQRAPRSPHVWNAAGLVALNRGDVATAKAAFRKALEIAPGFAAAIRNLAALLEREGKHDEARRLLDRLRP